ncbi:MULTISPECIES: tetratricopeptide repeat protein [Winogradskyella]|uniref:tetratricopeptide repeat protein n=1 Tax=Winogradskyella TaxID=286104 RepID=UPI0015CBDD8D|nr:MULTISPECIES: tetratricopeptide repeat protein [Winogradskyella]QXP78776.1 tetratricopeptide repeat protein [Winogradskyella sp. HaHa_3_26]
MGLFDFLRKKNTGIELSKFNSQQFQTECCALALWKLKENNYNLDIAIKELRKIGLSNEQADAILQKVNKHTQKETELKLENTEFGISDEALEKILNGVATKEQIKSTLDKLFSFATYQGKNGKSKNAIDLFNKCILINPHFIGAYVNLSALYYDMDNYEESLKIINKAIKLDPSNKVLYQNKAITCNTIENHNEEKKCYEKIVEIDINDIDALFALSQCQVIDNEFEPALKSLNKVINLAPNKEELHGPQLSKIGVLLELGFEKEAMELYHKMIERFPDDPSIHSIIPNLYYFKNKKHLAFDFFDSRYKQTKDIQYLKHKADFLFHRDKEKALESYEQYLKFIPNDSNALECRIALMSELKKKVDVKSEANKILDIDPNNINALHNKVRELFLENSFQEAFEIAERIYSLDKNNMNSISLLIQVGEKFKSEKEIIELLEKLKTENQQEKYNIEYQKGLYYKSIGQDEKAISVFNSQNLEYDFAWNYYQIAIIKNNQKKTNECLDYLEKAIQRDLNIKQDARHYQELKNLFDNPEFKKITE